MARVSLTNVILRNFGPFVGEHVFELTPSGIVAIKGKNFDTGGESGSGKSYVLHAIAYAFDHAKLSAKEMQCWLTEDPMEVEVHMDTTEGPAVLMRGRKLSLQIGAKLFKGSAAAVEAEIDRLTGVNAKLRAMLTYRGQKKPGLFLSMTDSQKKEFFIEVLGLHWAEKALDDSAERLTQLKKDVEREQTKVTAARAQFDYAKSQVIEATVINLDELGQKVRDAKARAGELEDALEGLERDKRRFEREEAAEAEAAKQQFAGEIAALEQKANDKRAEWKATTYDTAEHDRLVAKITECRARRDALQRVENEREEGYNHETRQIRDQLDDLNREISAAKALGRERQQIINDLLLLEQQKCQTCSRPWDGAQAEYEAKSKRLTEINIQISEADLLRGKVEELKERVTARKFEPDPKLQKYDDFESQLKEKLAAEKQKLASAKAVVEAEARAYVSDLKQQVYALNLKGRDAANEILQNPKRSSLQFAELQKTKQVETNDAHLRARAAAEELRRAETANETSAVAAARSQQQVAYAQAELTKAEGALREQTYLYNAESDFHAMIQGFLNSIFDEILEEISDEANVALAQLPNVAHLTIRFVSEHQTQKNTTKQTIVPTVQFNGHERPLSGCSGGMETSVELAVDLAVARVVGRRKDVELAWLILDESFTGHDQITKEGCLEVLQKYAADRLVLIIDHGAEMKEAITKTIEIEHENGISRMAT